MDRAAFGERGNAVTSTHEHAKEFPGWHRTTAWRRVPSLRPGMTDWECVWGWVSSCGVRQGSRGIPPTTPGFSLESGWS